MVTRKKTLLEKILSFNQHRRRFGARKFIYDKIDFDELKRKKISAMNFLYTHGSKTKITEHLQDLKKEFSGKSRTRILSR
jgi:predicted transcriptional regulator